MPENFQDELSPIIVITFLLGLGAPKFSKSRLRFCVLLLYTSLVWSIYIFSIYFITYVLTRNSVTRLSHTPGMATLYCSAITMFIVMLDNFYYRKEYQECYKSLDAIDKTLRGLGVPSPHKQTYYYVLKSLAAWGSITLIGNLLSIISVALTNSNVRHIIYVMATINHALNCTTLLNLKIINTFSSAGVRFDRLNKYIKNLTNCRLKQRTWFEEELMPKPHVPVTDDRCIRALWIAIHLHSELCKVFRRLNSLFEVPIVLEMIASFISLMSVFLFATEIDIFNHMHDVIETMRTFFVCLAAIINVFRIIFINQCCERIAGKARSTVNIIDEFISSIENTEYRKDATFITLKMMQRPLIFSGLGRRLGYTYIKNVCIFVTNVVVILLQMNIVTLFVTAGNDFIVSNSSSVT